jgi:hypothetical protein
MDTSIEHDRQRLVGEIEEFVASPIAQTELLDGQRKQLVDLIQGLKEDSQEVHEQWGWDMVPALPANEQTTHRTAVHKVLASLDREQRNAPAQSGLTREDQEASMYAAGMKAHGTGLGGMYSQRAVRALRGDDLKAVLEVTYPVTQSILQAKHSASEARHKYEMLQGPGRDLWRGRKLEHEGPGVWKPVYEDGEAVQASTEEWIQQFNDFYSAADGFNVSIDPQNVAKVADALTDPTTGLIRNLEEDEQLAGTPLDRMAYGGDFETLVEIAKKRESLYDGEKASQFASAGTRRVLRENERQLSGEAEISELKVADSVIKSDVIAGHEDKARARGAMRRSTNAVSVGRPSTRLQSFEELAGNTSSSDYEMEV